MNRTWLTILLLCFVLPSANALVILQYHHIDDSTPYSTSTAPERFEAHLKLLDELGATIVRLEDAIIRDPDLLPDAAGGNDTELRIAITFDDAFASIYEKAFPLLSERQWPFTIFVAPNLVGLNRQYLSWDQLEEMQAGGATIANHSLGHEHLIRLEPGESEADWLARIKANTLAAERVLTEQLGVRPKLYALPYGEYRPSLVQQLHEMGYTVFGQQSGATTGIDLVPTVHPRFPMGGPYSRLGPLRDKINALPFPSDQALIDPLLAHAAARPSMVLTVSSALTRTHLPNCFGPSGSLALERLGQDQFRVTTSEPVPVGRSRFNCTLRATDGRYYWFSQLWMRRAPLEAWWEES